MNSFFGTDGIRAPVGTALLTDETLPIVAQSISQWIHHAHAEAASRPTVLIIHDTRNSCAYIKSIIKGVLLGASIDLVDAGVLPTPAASYMMQGGYYACALIVSASHNPWRDNGIKIIDRAGKLSEEAEKKITDGIRTPLPRKVNYHNLGREQYKDANQEYIYFLTRFFKKEFLRKKKIVLDCANGSTSAIADKLFSSYGADVLTLNNNPTGFNINEQCGSTFQEGLVKTVIETESDIGFSFDGDGDRVIAVTREGIVKNGDDILALLSTHADYRHQKAIIGTIMSNMGLEQLIKQQGKAFIRTPVGDKYVAHELERRYALLGGEQSGHIILKNYTTTGDGMLVALKVLETLIEQNNPTFETFTPFPQILITVPVKTMRNLLEEPYKTCIDKAQKSIPFGRISVRYSGTEKNMLRIMVESPEYNQAYTQAYQLAQSLQKELS